MLNCKISKGISSTCGTNVAGVLRMAIANWGEYTFTQSTGSCEVDTIDMGTEKVYELAFADGTGVATATGTVGANADSKYYMHTVGGLIPHLDCDLLSDYNNFFLGRVIVFVETKNHEVFAFGVDNGLIADTFEYTSGTAEGDATGVTFQFTGAQPNGPVKIKDWTIVTGLMS